MARPNEEVEEAGRSGPESVTEVKPRERVTVTRTASPKPGKEDGDDNISWRVTSQVH